MKRTITLLAGGLFAASCFAQNEPAASPGYAPGSERIVRFHSDISADSMAGLTVTETIRVHSTGDQIKRGIYRTLPLSRNLNDATHRVKYDIVSIKRDGKKEDYHTETGDGFLKIYIGNENVILNPGDYEYEIQYQSKNHIGFFDDYDELYWNVNGTDWNFPADSVSAVVRLPQGARILQDACYTGAYGETDRNCTSRVLSENTIAFYAAKFNSYQGLTIAAGFSKGVIAPPPPPGFLEKFGVLIGGIIALLCLLAYYFVTWRRYGIDPEKPVVYPQFSAPDNLSPAELGYIRTEKFGNNLVTAAIVDLAVKGYVQIVEKKDSKLLGLMSSRKFTLKKLKAPDIHLPKEEANLLRNLFSGRNTVEFDGTYDSKIGMAVEEFKTALEGRHSQFLNEGNNTGKLYLPGWIITGVYALGLTFSYGQYPEMGNIIVGIVLYVVLLVVFILVVTVFHRRAPFLHLFWIVPAGFFLFKTISISKGLPFSINENFNICYIFIVLGFASLIFYQYYIQRPSEEKLRKKSLIDGFEMYLGAAESETLKFHNPPQMTPEIFEKFLPFAIVLGVDAIWGKKFEQVLKQMATDYTSNWYTGSSVHHAAFGNALNSGLTSSIKSAATPPSSSGSGSDGGGSSGGGGGGGGGGGW